MLCQYKDIFGKTGEGVHSYRLFNIAIVDVLATILGAFVLSYITNKSFMGMLIALFITGIALHYLFCVRTTVDKLLFQ
jgi:hypothetical protein